MPVPDTRTATSHVISIRFRGVTIGTIQRWSPRQQRRQTRIYELNSATSGRAVEVVPGNVEQLQIDVQRYDLYSVKMHEAFGFAATASNLADHTTPFEVMEVRKLPSGVTETTIYTGCWFSNIGKEMAATGERTIQVNAQIECTDFFEA